MYRLFYFLLLASMSLFFATSAAQEDFVTTQGREIIHNGKPVILRGINLGNWLVPEGYMFGFKDISSPRMISQVIQELVGPDKARKFWKEYRDNYITQEDIRLLKKIGFNSVRVPFNFRLFVSEEHPEIFIKTGFEMLSRVMQWCKEERIWIILDMHCAPGGQTGDNIDDSWAYPYLYESEESQELTISLWKKIAEKYKDEQYLVGYDLLNEPIAHYYNTEKLNPLLEPLFKRIVAGIREVDKNHIVFIGGAQWNSNFKVFGPPFDSKSVYTFHKYWTEPTQAVIEEYIAYSQKYNVPIWMGESGENTNEWISTFRSVLEKNRVGWCFWPYKKLDSTSCIASIRKTREFEEIIAYTQKPRNTYQDIRNNRPMAEIIEQALADFLKNCKLENCTINQDYITALGFTN